MRSTYNKWSLEEINYLLNNYSKYGPEYCSKYLNRTKYSVFSKCRILNIKVDYSIITEFDDIKLSENWKKY